MSVLTTDQFNMLRGGGYEGSAYFVAGPQDIVFAARVNGTPSASDFAQITYDTVTTGAYTDLIVDMDVRISHTNDIRAAFFYGRVRKTPTSTILYINETSAAIVDNDYIFAVNNYPLVIRQRYKSYVDWDVAYTKLPPIESNVDSAYVSLTTASTASFSLSSIGQALEKSATISSRLWTIPGASYTVGSNTSADITFTVTTPYNKWGHLRLTDSNGVTNTLHFTITAGNPNTATFFRLCHEPPTVNSDWDNGLSTAVTFWTGVNDLLDRTRVTIVSDEIFDGEALGVSNILFVGYLKSRTSNTAGDETHGQRKDVEWECSGLMQLAAELRFNQIAIRHATTPSAWDYINVPTYQRNICHLLGRHSTLLNLVSMDFGTIDDTYSSGNSNLGETSLTDAARACIKEINGYLINDAAGKITLIRDPRIGSDAYRATIPDKTPEPIDLGDGYSYKLNTDPYDKIGWMEVGFAVIHPTTLARTYITANAPASGPGDGQEDATEPSQLLAATGTLSDALDEARQRTGDLYAVVNTHRTIEWALVSGWGGVVYATPGEYYQFLIDPADDEAGVGVDAGDDWLCVSVSTTINRNGTQGTTAKFTEVTQGGDSLIKVAVSPSVVATPIPVVPFASPYPSQPVAPSINYDSTTPTRKIPRDPFSGLQMAPLKTEEAAEAALKQAGPEEEVIQISFRNPSAVNTGFISVLGAPYTIHFSGSAAIDNTTTCTDFTASDPGWAIPSTGVTWTAGSGYGRLDNSYVNLRSPDHTVSVHSVTVSFKRPWLNDDDFERYFVIVRDYGGGNEQYFNFFSLLHDQEHTFVTGEGNIPGTPDWTGLEVLVAAGGITWPVDQFVSGLCLTISGDGGEDIYADAFYTGQADPESGDWIDVTPNTAGGARIDNNGITIFPPFNKNHEYDVTLEDFNGVGGTGSTLEVVFLDDEYSDNDPQLLTLRFKGAGAGS